MGAPPVKTDGFTKATAALVSGSLGSKLARVADKVRDLNTRLGFRQYSVRVVRTRWTGGRRSVGVEEVVSELDILPTPLVVDLGTLAEVVTPFGTNESGAVQVQEISHRYTEEMLLGVDPVGRQPGPDEQVYWEIQWIRPDGRPAERRRMQISAAPSYAATKFQWMLTLSQANENRNRDGEPAP